MRRSRSSSIPVLGKPEDAADSFAAVGLIRIGSTFTQRVLADAAKGWFLNDRRDVATDDTVAFYDEHGLDQQRAYQIVCFMVGSDDEKFKDLAKEVKLPPERQDTCGGDYSNASWSWDQVLKPHVRTADQPVTKIDVIYGEAKGPLETVANMMKSIGLLEALATHTGEAFVWPAPFTIEAQTCGFPECTLGPADPQAGRLLRARGGLRRPLPHLRHDGDEGPSVADGGPQGSGGGVKARQQRARKARRSILRSVVRGSSSMNS